MAAIVQLPLDEFPGHYVCEYNMAAEVAGVIVHQMQHKDWFKVQMQDSFRERLSSIQLVTKSCDGDPSSWADAANGNWSWFELAIETEARAGTREIRKLDERNECIWMSHENRLFTAASGWRHGKVFHKGHRLIKSLKQDDSIVVRICALFGGWTVKAEEARLIFHFDSKPSMFLPAPTTVPVTIEAPNLTRLQSLLGLEIGGSAANTNTKVNIDGVDGPKTGILIEELPLLNGDEMRTYLESLRNRARTNTILVIDTEHIRSAGISISKLSWHQTLRDIYNNFLNSPPYNANLKGYHVIVRVGYEGAAYRAANSNETEPLLVFEPSNREGVYLRSQTKYTADDKARLEPELKAAFLAGLAASFREESHQSIRRFSKYQVRQALFSALNCPRRFAAFHTADNGSLLRAFENVSLLGIAHRTDADPTLVPVNTGTDLWNTNPPISQSVFDSMGLDPKIVARDIVTWGPEEVLSVIPTATYGGIQTADRTEIEGFRKVADKIEEYLAGEDSKPLSIAVFGQPGSGKSFGIKEVARSILLDHGYQKEDTRPLEFNLSLMDSEQDLICAFQTIREKQLSRKVPIVLFDEFDSQGCRWLQDFYEPMSEGTFTDSGIRRPLGRGIYVFIGGTSKTWDEFRTDTATANQQPAEPQSQPNSGPDPEPEPEPAAEPVPVPESDRPLAQYIDCDLSSYPVSLPRIFHAMRDTTIRGRVPIVLLKGFNQPEKWVWLQRFLSPMQDALFLDNGQTRAIGQGIFVFIETPGGSSLPNGPQEVDYNADSFVMAKGPDFLSRLRGRVARPANGELDVRPLYQVIQEYLKTDNRDKPLSVCVTNVNTDLTTKLDALGLYQNEGTQRLPLYRQQPTESRNRFVGQVKAYVNIIGPNPVGEDKMYIVRRAILLRSLLQRRVKAGRRERIDVEAKVLSALLYVDRYHHGARSMEAILAMSALSQYKQNRKFKREYLPGPSTGQLALHVDQSQFTEELNRSANHEVQVAEYPGGPSERSYTEQNMMRLQVGLPWPYVT